MLAPKKDHNQATLFFSLSDSLNQRHPLYILSNKVDCQGFENVFSSLYCENNGRPAKPICMMVGLLILKHLRNLSDESVVEQWAENNYYQYFCGENAFVPQTPCEASELVHFRKRIGEKGIELIFQESIRINGKDGGDQDVYTDTTVQEKISPFPPIQSCTRKLLRSAEKSLPMNI